MITVPQQAGMYRPGHSRAKQSPYQRIIGIAFAATIEVGLVYALLSALGVVPMPPIRPPLTIFQLPPDVDQPEIPAPIPPVVEVPRIPEPVTTEITVQIPENVVRNPITESPPQPQPEQKVATLEQPPPVTLSPARALMATHTTPDYPPLSRRLGEQGMLRLTLTITPQGAVSDAMIVNSSGYPRLDLAAVDWVKAHWRYQPATRGSTAVPSTADAVVTFKLQ